MKIRSHRPIFSAAESSATRSSNRQRASCCGDSGKGKLCDIKDILEYVDHYFQRSDLLKGKHVLITAGPTQEALDPVRYLTNHSSGKMGYALAQAALDMGASVTLISGPVQLNAPKGAKLIPVKTAVEMFDAVVNCYEQADFIIKAAAVGDYRPFACERTKNQKKRGQPPYRVRQEPRYPLPISENTNETTRSCAALRWRHKISWKMPAANWKTKTAT